MSGYFDNKNVFVGDLAGNLLNAGLRAEVLFAFPDDAGSEMNINGIIGIDYQITPEIYTLLEYHYNGEGTSDTATYDLERLIRGEIENLNRNYISASIYYFVHPLVTINATSITNLNDGSLFGTLKATRSISDNINLSIGFALFVGENGAEYLYYPASVNLPGEYYL